ncbi:hypothetical protein LA080_011465 [Diaporthe eres]|nr:hypothetical protein LA080_011465 [Diaporthe eres]
MASKEPQVHRLGLGRIVVDGNLQPIVRVATLTLKDEEPDKHIMQVHVDGSTLAQWDLGTLKERKSTGGEQFLSISEQKMLHFTLPLLETEGQTIVRGTELKTIQLFILKLQDFHTAINYLSHNAGMRHCHLKNVSANLMDANAPRQAQSQPREPSAASTMEPPMGPPMGPSMGPRVRSLSQASVFGPVRFSPAQFVRRPQTARPNSMGIATDTFDLRFLRTLEASSPRMEPASPNGFPVEVMAWEVLELEIEHYCTDNPHQIETGTGHVPHGPYNDRFGGQPADQAGQASSSARHTISMRTSPFDEHPSSRLPPKRPASRSPSISERGVPVNIQVLGPPDGSSCLDSRPNIRWEFTLHLLPSTKMWELYLYAASYIRREYRSTVDGRALTAQSRNGTVFEDQNSLPEVTLQGEPLFLIERRLAGAVQPVSANVGRESMEALHPDWTTQAGNHNNPHSAYSEDSSQAIDEADQPGGRQKRPPSASKRPASSAGGSKLDSISATTQRSKPQILERRPKTSLGIPRKRKAPSSDEGVSAATPSVIESVPSGAEANKQEMAKTPCMGCRNKKRKCDRLKPACGQCLKDNRPCTYPNIQETATTVSIADKACKGYGVEVVNHPMVLRSEAVTCLPVTSDASTQTSHSRESRDIATQTQAAEPDKIEVDMKDMGTDPCNLYTGASMETEGCDDIWIPFSQAAEVVVWACRRSEEQRPKAVEIFKITDPSHENYQSQVEQAALYAARFEKELREKCEQVLRR